jgi:Kdo2-lipid IVA lauroyltransferase/acyltransferase
VSRREKPLSLWKRIRFRLEWLALELLAALVPLLSHKMLMRFANGLGWLAFHLAAGERHIALTNLDIAFGSSKSMEEKRRIARGAFQTFARSSLSLFWARRPYDTTLSQLVEFDPASVQLVKEAQARGKGIIFITLHYGNWELIGLATPLLGIPSTIVTEQTRNLHVKDIFERLRGRTGNRIILQRFAVAKLFKALKRGESIALLIDLNALPSRGGVWLDFFGKPVFSYSAAAGLALHTGAAILGGVAHPLANGRIRIEYGPEIPCVHTGDEEADLRTLSQQCLRLCEDVIRQKPEYWLWFYRRWKFRPTKERGSFPEYSRYIEDTRSPRAQKSNPPQTTSVAPQSGP